MSLIWLHVCVAAFVLLWSLLLEVATIFQQCVCVENHWARMAPETPTGAPAKEATENKLAFAAAAAAVATRGCCHYQCAICIHTSQTLPKTNKERRSSSELQTSGRQTKCSKQDDDDFSKKWPLQSADSANYGQQQQQKQQQKAISISLRPV